MVIPAQLEKIYWKIDDERIKVCCSYEEACYGCPHFYPNNGGCAFEKIKRHMERVLTAIDPHREHVHEEEEE